MLISIFILGFISGIVAIVLAVNAGMNGKRRDSREIRRCSKG